MGVGGDHAVGHEVGALSEVGAGARPRRSPGRRGCGRSRLSSTRPPSGPNTRTESGSRVIASLKVRSTEVGGVVSTASAAGVAPLEHRVRGRVRRGRARRSRPPRGRPGRERDPHPAAPRRPVVEGEGGVGAARSRSDPEAGWPAPRGRRSPEAPPVRRAAAQASTWASTAAGSAATGSPSYHAESDSRACEHLTPEQSVERPGKFPRVGGNHDALRAD